MAVTYAGTIKMIFILLFNLFYFILLKDLKCHMFNIGIRTNMSTFENIFNKLNMKEMKPLVYNNNIIIFLNTLTFNTPNL